MSREGRCPILSRDSTDLDRWAQSLPGHEPERRHLAQQVLSALLRYLEEKGGPPPDSIRERGVEPPTWWWRWEPHFWIRFCVEDVRTSRLAFWKKTRRITVVRVSPSLPRNLSMR